MKEIHSPYQGHEDSSLDIPFEKNIPINKENIPMDNEVENYLYINPNPVYEDSKYLEVAENENNPNDLRKKIHRDIKTAMDNMLIGDASKKKVKTFLAHSSQRNKETDEIIRNSVPKKTTPPINYELMQSFVSKPWENPVAKKEEVKDDQAQEEEIKNGQAQDMDINKIA